MVYCIIQVLLLPYMTTQFKVSGNLVMLVLNALPTGDWLLQYKRGLDHQYIDKLNTNYVGRVMAFQMPWEA